jgi:Acetyltransferase (GNAT) family
LIGVISLFSNPSDPEEFRFRKFAVDTTYQHCGVGTALLEYTIQVRNTMVKGKGGMNIAIFFVGFVQQ